ncbi:MAG: hypothetical protein HC802_05925 [Caldilineaceae bacterium]|nr:hypothetical protein [Caldilineaceae bacterium]
MTTTLSERIANLPPEKRAVIERYLLDQQAAQPNDTAIPRRGADDPSPLSFAQERLWFLAQLEPDSPAYNGNQVIHILGELNVGALERSLDALAARHDSLRVCFREVNGVVLQVTDPLPPSELPLIDLTHLLAASRMPKAWERITVFRNKIFDLTRPPLWRAMLIRLADNEHLFVRIDHHIITDGWSNSIFWRELDHIYSGLVGDGRVVQLPPLSVSYKDFSAWQRDWLQGERLARLVGYWRDRLADLQPLELPSDRQRPIRLSHTGKAERFRLGLDLSERLTSLARASGSSLYILLLACFQVLLHRYSGQADIAVGSPIANRNHSQTEGLYGFFVNTLVMRADCGGNISFRSLLAQVRQNALEAYDRQDLPFEKLVEELHPPRELNRNPLFDVMFSLQNMPRSEVQLADLHCQRLSSSEVDSKFDLSLFMHESDNGLEGSLGYATQLFNADTIQRMVGHFQTLLEGIVEDPDCPIGQLPLLTSAERQQILVEWNDSTTDYPQNLCIHHSSRSRSDERLMPLRSHSTKSS